MRDRLIGYVLGALDVEEHQELECELGQNARLREELELARRALTPLESDREPHDPPTGLASSICRRVAALRVERVATSPGVWQSDEGERARGRTRGWSLVDLAVAAGIVLAAGALFLPAINHSRFNAQVTHCQSNLAGIGQALHSFSAQNPDHDFPSSKTKKLVAAGLYAPQLLDYVRDPKIFYCGGSGAPSDQQGSAKIPTLVNLESANDHDAGEMLRRAGGSYGYTLGHMDNAGWHTTHDSGRTHFPIMADAPCPKFNYEQSSNHGGHGQNVLFEDGHVRYLTSCRQPSGCPDSDFFRNDEGKIAAGKGTEDAVIGCSWAKP